MLYRYAAFVAFIGQVVSASFGDRLILYQTLYQSCIKRKCANSEGTNFESNQPFYLLLFSWDCNEECKFQSQWKTIEELKQNGFHDVPQFFGKWTFYRFFGIQEPASFLFSTLNFITNLYGWNKYSKSIGRLDPLYFLWTTQTIVTLHAWLWSIIFHGRDTTFTEKLDYFSAYLVIIFSLCAITIKIVFEMSNSSLQNLTYITIGMPFISFYIYHIFYLYFVQFDYGYNMKVNVITGFLCTTLWLAWCYVHRQTRKHTWKCFLSFVLVNLCLLLELFDFPPLAFVFDAHSIWHFATFPLPLLWFNFLTDEAFYLVNNKNNNKTCDTDEDSKKLL